MEPDRLSGVTLDRLVAALEAAHPDVRDRIPDAMVVAEHLDRLGDDLIGHVVATARAQGVSWSEIGTRMGVSKQAAQQRIAKASQVELDPLSPEQGFTRFTIEARNLVMAAHETARVRREPFVTPGRLAVAAGIESASARLPEPADEAQDLVPYDEAAQQVLSRAFDVAIAADADMVDVPHVVAALGEDFVPQAE
ncbi:ATP-dependent Clp protease ATP-binding subunit [Aeromicrobium sp. IC_218]|uniref:ATP-dependent Clp protease ATP-binding subunit n=1 Tax=Aeromicrobium sp. IC_218 TaxID=2545468 RepID=UPI00103F31E4|nr:ATP-dependent Clp protease ATP-binding subunit [Aeromicrobium sp. IC_218]TCI98820.1 ATP-dependent Clp protease ATP-binding subunit [Aeromicrobium sp. IC_218]